MNKVIHGDCREVFFDWRERQGFKPEVDLIYIDPPFYTQRDWGEFDDRWESMDDYLDFIKKVLTGCWSVMKDQKGEGSSIYVHCDTTASHRIRVLMDDIFGAGNFRNEIVWCYKKQSVGTRNRFQRDHDTILFYSYKGATFNKLHGEFTDHQKQIMRLGYHMGSRREKRVLIYDRLKVSQEMIDKWEREGRKVLYHENPKGKAVTDVWEMSMLAGGANEREGYPTQKPERLIHRIIEASTNRGDTVLDPMCGSGTALVAAKQLGRNYIGMDANKRAVEIAEKRLGELLI